MSIQRAGTLWSITGYRYIVHFSDCCTAIWFVGICVRIGTVRKIDIACVLLTEVREFPHHCSANDRKTLVYSEALRK